VAKWRELGNVTRQQWADVLQAARSPLHIVADRAYDAAAPHTALCLAMLHVESQFGTAFNANSSANQNFLNLRPPIGGGFMAFPTAVDGIRAWRERITSPTYKNGIYAGTTTIEELIHIYAPSTDGNREDQYVASIKADLDRWGVEEGFEPEPTSGPRIVLNPGHRNATGGNEEERNLTPALADSYFRAFKAAGFEVINLGDTAGGLDAACRRMVDAIEDAPGDVVLLDLHYEGSSAPGVFAIVPDITGLVTNAQVIQDRLDTWENNSKDRDLARAIATEISQRTGLGLRQGVREPGMMDESETGVGGDGFRLATFAYTSPLRRKAVRLVVEHGNHTLGVDRAIIFKNNFTTLCAEAAVAAVKKLYGGSTAPADPQFPRPAAISWKRGDTGVFDLNGTPALAFLFEVKSAVDGLTPQVSATVKKAVGPPIPLGQSVIAIGSYRGGPNRDPFVVLDGGGRVPHASVTPALPLP
jgi:hypothetical protein